MSTEGIDKVKTRLSEIIVEHEKTLFLYLKGPDRFIEGKIEAYKNCLMLIETYTGD